MRSSGLRKGIAVFVVSQVALLLGIILGYRQILHPLMRWATQSAENAVGNVVNKDQSSVLIHYIALFLLASGLYLTFVSLRLMLNTVITTLNPGLTTGRVDVYFRRVQLANGPRVASLGGGTGLSTILRGIKQHTSNITAIVTVTDDGGSSGRLTQDKQMKPPGDIRNCMVALADAEKAMTDLFQHRFKNDSGSLSGHSLGNLLIAGFVDQAKGDFERAVEMASDVLAIRGRVVPATLDTVSLRARLDDHSEVCGETKIAQAGRRIEKIFVDPPDARPHPSAIEAVHNADVVCVGPGSVYTSVIPNLRVPGIPEAIIESKALKIYICNVMTQPGESDTFSASQHVKVIHDMVGYRLFDYVMVNTGVPPQDVLDRYMAVGQHYVEPDIDIIRSLGYKVITGNFMSDSDLVRHDPMKVAAKIMQMVNDR